MFCCSLSSSFAQRITPSLTVYKEFKPAIILLNDGRKLNQPLANIFLKNSSLLYMKDTQAMEANLDNIMSVDFDDRSYIKIDTLLAFLVDTVGNNALYCAEQIDLVSYKQSVLNNHMITNIGLGGDQLSSTTIDIMDEEDIHFPVVPLYFFRINGEFIFVHERSLSRHLSKEKRRMMKSIMALDGFSWTEKSSLLKLLKALE
jgi:hypothetical protein